MLTIITPPPLKLKNRQIFNNAWRGGFNFAKKIRMFGWGFFNFAKKCQTVWGGFYNVGPKIAKKIAPSARFPLVKSVFTNPKSHTQKRAFGAISPCKIGIYEPKPQKNRAFGAISPCKIGIYEPRIAKFFVPSGVISPCEIGIYRSKSEKIAPQARFFYDFLLNSDFTRENGQKGDRFFKKYRKRKFNEGGGGI